MVVAAVVVLLLLCLWDEAQRKCPHHGDPIEDSEQHAVYTARPLPRHHTGLDHEWGVELYGELLEIGGGKERMTKYFTVGRCREAAEAPLFLASSLTQQLSSAQNTGPRLLKKHNHTQKITPKKSPTQHATTGQDVADREPFRSTSDAAARADLVKDLHKLKTDLFMGLVETGAMPLRPGVARLVREAIDAGEAAAGAG